MKSLGLHLPTNSVSFGQLSTIITRTLFEREKAGKLDLDLFLFPIGQVDLSSQKKDEEYEKWLHSKIVKGLESWKRDYPVLKLWHLSDATSSFTNKIQTLISFYELDSPTKAEINVCKNNKTLFTSQYTVDLFKNFGCDNVHYLPPVFDSYNFNRIDKKFHVDGRIVFSLNGKFEKRKHTDKIIKAWIKKYGGNSKYVLQCAVYNPFLVQQTPQGVVDHNNQFISQAVNGNKPFNVVFYPPQQSNISYNELLNSANISIGFSGGEAIDLPCFQSVAMGKHAVILNCNGYKSWATKENAVLIDPSGKEDAYDGVFFHKGQAYNQGQIFSFDETAFIDGCEQAIKRAEVNPLNSEGLKLKDVFSVDKFVDNILKLTLE